MAKTIVSMSSTIGLKRLRISVLRIALATLSALIGSFRELQEVHLLHVQSDKMDDSVLEAYEANGVSRVYVPQKPIDAPARYRTTTEGILSFMLGSRVGARRRNLEIHSFELEDNFIERLVEAFYEIQDVEWAELAVRDFPRTSQKLDGFEGMLIQVQSRAVFFDVQGEGFFSRVSFETHQSATSLPPQTESLWVRFTNDQQLFENIMNSWAHS